MVTDEYNYAFLIFFDGEIIQICLPSENRNMLSKSIAVITKTILRLLVPDLKCECSQVTTLLTE